MTEMPSSITYSSVVLRDSVRVMFLVVALNDLLVWMTDVGNAYLNAAPTEKIYTTAGPEFGQEDEGKTVIIVRTLYGLKSSGAVIYSSTRGFQASQFFGVVFVWASLLGLDFLICLYNPSYNRYLLYFLQ